MAWCGTKKAKKLLTMDPSLILVFDLETTDVISGKAEILQIAITDGNGCPLFSSLVKPTHRKSWSQAEKVNHISPEMVENAPTFNEIREQIQDCFNQAKLIAGYNIKRFDVPVIERYGIVVPVNRFDLMEEFRQYTGRVVGYRLQDCADYFHTPLKAHDADEDARTTAECMQQLIREPGFVNTNSVMQKKLATDQEFTSENGLKKLPLRARLLKPLLKTRRIPLAVAGLFLMLISFLWLCYQTYDYSIISSLNQIEIGKLLDTVRASNVNLVIGVLFPVGVACFVWGVIRGIKKLILRIINMFRKIFH